MSDTDEKVAAKITHAELYLARVRNPENETAAQADFGSMLACIRSATMYIHEWQIANGRAANKKEWGRINSWENTLPPDEHAAWRGVVDLRNHDIHEEPVATYRAHRGGHFDNWFGPDYMGDWFGGKTVREVLHPDTGAVMNAVEIGELSLRVLRRLAAAYRTL